MTESFRQKIDRAGLAALGIYSALALVLFGVPLMGHFRDAYLGTGNDPSGFSWFLVWWPHAIAHGMNPLFAPMVSAPGGFNLTWATSIPFVALAAAPVTFTMGAIAGFNILCMLATPLAAWTAFLLYRYVSKSWWPSLAGGYIFGFSAYMAGHQACGHLVVTLVFFIPLAALIVAHAISSDVERHILIVGLVAVLIGQFLVSIELFATMTVAGATALLLGWSFAPPEIAARLRKLVAPIAVAYAISALILSPYLYAFFASGMPQGAIWPADIYSGDLLNFILPVPSTAIGVIHLFERITMPFRLQGSIAEMDGYIGLPVLAITALYAWRRFREPLGRTLVEFLMIFCVLSLGPLLHVAGVATIGMPFKIFLKLPLLDKALPSRLMVFPFLALGMIVTLWLGSARLGAWSKGAVIAIVVFSTLPTPSSRWITPADSPTFFAAGTYREFLTPSDNVLPLPFGYRGSSMLWHAQTGMYFRMVSGWTGAAPEDFYAWPMTAAFGGVRYLPNPSEQFAALLAHYSINVVIVSQSDPDASSWNSILTPLASSTQHVGGVDVHRISAAALARYRLVTPQQMNQRNDEAIIDSLVLAASEWQPRRDDSTPLTPFSAIERGLLEKDWFVGSTIIPGWISGGSDRRVDTTRPSFAGVLLDNSPAGDLNVGVSDSYAMLEPVVAMYRTTASHIYFPYPNDLLASGTATPSPQTQAVLTLVLDKQQVSRVATSLRASPRQNALLSFPQRDR